MRQKSLSPFTRHNPPAPPAHGTAAARASTTASAGSHAFATWSATIAMVLLVPALIIPRLVTDAAGPRLTLNPAAQSAGGTVEVRGTGFAAESRGFLSFDSQAKFATFAADRTGTFSLRISVPTGSALGAHAVSAVSGSPRQTLASVQLTVIEPAATPAPNGTYQPTASPRASARGSSKGSSARPPASSAVVARTFVGGRPAVAPETTAGVGGGPDQSASPGATPGGPGPSDQPGATPSPEPTQPPTPRPTPRPTPKPTPKPPPASSGRVPYFDHIFVIVEENRAFNQVIGNASAPYLNSLANSYGLATNYRAITHPSLPNYIAMVGGSTYGITSDCSPSSCPVNGLMIGDRIEGAGKSWRAYMEGMSAPCGTTNGNGYAAKHNPFVYFTPFRSNTARCAAHDVPYTGLAGDLASAVTTPNFVWITPNVCNDMHDCSVATGDAWLRSATSMIFASPAWRTQNSLLLITWDEDDFTSVNQVATIMVGSSVNPGRRSTAYNHYSLLRTVETSWGLAPLAGGDASAAPMRDFFR